MSMTRINVSVVIEACSGFHNGDIGHTTEMAFWLLRNVQSGEEVGLSRETTFTNHELHDTTQRSLGTHLFPG